MCDWPLTETDLVRQIDDCRSRPIRFIAIFEWRRGGLSFANKGIVQPGENEAAYNAVEKSVQNAHDQITDGP